MAEHDSTDDSADDRTDESRGAGGRSAGTGTGAGGAGPTRGRGRVLVTGASVAGPATAYWLERVGYDVTVLERAAEPRRGGQNVDVRGLAKEVLDRMDLLDAVRAAGTGEVGTRFVDDDGRAVAQFPAREGEDGPTAELEILRGELARVLVEACGERVTWWSGDRVVDLEQGDDGVLVRLAGGGEHRFDLVVVAEGAGSQTRGLVLTGDDAPRLRRLGMHTVWATIPRTEHDDDWWRWLSATGSRAVSLRPDNVGTTRATLSWMGEEPGFTSLERDARLVALRERFGDLRWEVPRVLDALEALAPEGDELYAEDLTQVHAPTWRAGRVVLLGDAAWCVTPIAGAGTSLALVGAYVLAAELARLPAGAPPQGAFAVWEAWMRPLVEQAGKLPPGAPRIANPRSRLGVRLFRAGTRLAAARPVAALAGRLVTGPASDRELPVL